ncbi:hypothetical protein PV11_03704 [Exophiala sideris]|uniref:Uncharacterized protein n=1 Tax=Exophiala sideris TaxID=1016849 RepID=A0A0D1X227_9EURO|nr:hypothetical protein PV11_03704 [Exophiala sideris]
MSPSAATRGRANNPAHSAFAKYSSCCLAPALSSTILQVGYVASRLTHTLRPASLKLTVRMSVVKRAKKSGHSLDRPIEMDRDLSFTWSVYERLNEKYGKRVPLDQFVGLCAYLCTLLRWGWHVRSLDLDAFVQLYPEYETVLSLLEFAQCELDTIEIPSYHHWFTVQGREAFGEGIINEGTLRRLWQENHYEFLRAELSLEHIIRSSSGRPVSKTTSIQMETPQGDADGYGCDKTGKKRRREDI